MKPLISEKVGGHVLVNLPTPHKTRCHLCAFVDIPSPACTKMHANGHTCIEVVAGYERGVWVKPDQVGALIAKVVMKDTS